MTIDGEELLIKLIQNVSSNLYVQYNISSSIEEVLILDSSTEKKFSSHLIFPKIVFENNILCGVFVKNILDKLSKEEVEMLSLIDSHNKKKSIVDCSVYSLNQNFRIIFSSKFGKKTALKLSRINQFKLKNVQLELFLESLVCDKDLEVNIHSSIRDQDSKPVLSKINDADCFYSDTCSNLSTKLRDVISPSVSSKLSDIEKYLKSNINQGKISNVKFFENRNIVIFDVKNFRFCHNIGREHKRNNIYYVYDINKMVLYQKCYDQGCAGYRSPDINLTL